MGKKKFAAVALNPEYEIFVVHVASLSFTSLDAIYPSCRPQIASLIAKEAPTKVPTMYLDFADVFSPDLACKLPGHTEMNNYAVITWHVTRSRDIAYSLIRFFRTLLRPTNPAQRVDATTLRPTNSARLD